VWYQTHTSFCLSFSTFRLLQIGSLRIAAAVCNHITANITSHTLSYFHTKLSRCWMCGKNVDVMIFIGFPKKRILSIDICSLVLINFLYGSFPEGETLYSLNTHIYHLLNFLFFFSGSILFVFLSLAAIIYGHQFNASTIQYILPIYYLFILFYKNSFPIDIFRSRRANAWEFLLWEEKVWRRCCHTFFKSIVNGGRVCLCVGSNKQNEKRKKSSSVSWIVNACYTMRSHEFVVCWIDQPGRKKKEKVFRVSNDPATFVVSYTIYNIPSDIQSREPRAHKYKWQSYVGSS
jgi:hypothetical protein